MQLFMIEYNNNIITLLIKGLLIVAVLVSAVREPRGIEMTPYAAISHCPFKRENTLWLECIRVKPLLLPAALKQNELYSCL